MTNKRKYLELLAREYPNIQAATGEIVRLRAYCNLPKGTEYFFSDLHGEAGAFIHLMRSASGTIRVKIREVYGNTLTESEQNQLANLIYDSEKVLHILRERGQLDSEWIRFAIIRLAELLRYVSSKQARSAIRAKMPPEYTEIITELLYAYTGDFDRETYWNNIIAYIIAANAAESFIKALCHMIQRVSVYRLHIIGDIYDRGKAPNRIMEALLDFGRVDFQWGNHDIQWMGAAAGSEVCICSVIRANIAYNNFDLLEDGYSFNLRALSSFAQEVYKDDPCARFIPKVLDENVYDMVDLNLAAKMHKAIAILMFKLEAQLLERHPEYGMDDRKCITFTDFRRMVHVVDGREYPMLDTNFPTVDPDDPTKLSPEEELLLRALKSSFRHSEELHRHVAFLYTKGASYKVHNGNLLFHGCIPMRKDGSFDSLNIKGQELAGKALMDFITAKTAHAYYGEEGTPEHDEAVDFMWYLWCGPKSPMFGKSRIATYENYFVDDKELRREVYNPYYQLSEREEICDRILAEFGLSDQHSHIINGHVPVKIKDGERPVKAGRKLFVIDGGISKAYQPRTGIAGYTLIFNSHHLALAEHHSFDQIENDMGSYTPKYSIEDVMERRLLTSDTDSGKELLEKSRDLEELIVAYKEGLIKENLR